MKLVHLTLLLGFLCLALLGVIFYPSGGLYFEKGELEGERNEILSQIEERDSLLLERSKLIDSLEIKANQRLVDTIRIKQYYEKRYEVVRSANSDTTRIVLRDILSNYSTD